MSHTDSTHVKRAKADQSEATRAALVEVARKLFTAHGYAGTATEEVVRQAGVTRGALYHQFRDKRDLFEAVFEQVERDLATRIANAAAEAPDLWARFVAGCEACLDSALDPTVRQIVFIDGPSVLGRETWHRIDSAYALTMVQAGLDAAIAGGLVAAQPTAPLAALLVGAVNEASMVVAHAADVPAARREVGESLRRLLGGLRTRTAEPERPPSRGREKAARARTG